MIHSAGIVLITVIFRQVFESVRFQIVRETVGLISGTAVRPACAPSVHVAAATGLH